MSLKDLTDKFNTLIKKNTDTLAYIFVFFTIGISLFTNREMEVEFFFQGDSINRARNAFEIFDYGFRWNIGGFWLPFQFVLFTIPLLVSKSIEALILFQILLSALGLLLFYRLVKIEFSPLVALGSVVLAGLGYTRIFLSCTIMSENPYFLFLVCALLFAKIYLENGKTLNLYLTAIFLAGAGMMRHEGAFLFLGIWILLSIKNRNPFHITSSIFIYLVPFLLYEYTMYQETGIPFYAMATNGEESYQVNVTVLKLVSFGDRFAEMIMIFVRNNGLFAILGTVFMGVTLGLKQFKNPYYLITGMSIGMATISAMQGSIALFDRYFIPAIIFAIPYGFSCFKLVKGRLSPYLISFSILFIFGSSLYSLQRYSTSNTFESKRITRDLVQFEGITSDTKIFFDDVYASWSFDAFYIYFYTHGISQHCCNIDNYKWLKHELQFTPEITKEFIELNKENKFEIFVIHKASSTAKFLNENNLIVENTKLKKIREYRDIILYKSTPYSSPK